jgi:hypothetical protein
MDQQTIGGVRLWAGSQRYPALIEAKARMPAFATAPTFMSAEVLS